MVRISLGLGIAVACCAGSAAAQSAPPSSASGAATAAAAERSTSPTPSLDADTATMRSTGATRRSGFTAGILGALAVGDAAGYPNDFSKLDNPIYHASTTGIGSAATFYIGGALTDWFTFGFGLATSSFGSSRLVSKSTAFVFHIETFPLFARGGVFRDLALFADVGTGIATLKRKEDDAEFSNSGGLSIGGAGAFWEAWRLGGHLAFGPFAAWQYQSSDAMTRQFTEVGIRGAFYGGP
jgi:hypothetical protein